MIRRKVKFRRIVVALWMGCSSGREILSGIFRFAKSTNDWHITLLQLPNGFSPDLLTQTLHAGIDGIITCSTSHPILRKLIRTTTVPVVVIGQDEKALRHGSGPIAFVNCDDVAIGEKGARHFMAIGNFNGFGFLHSAENRQSNDREVGFRTTLKKAGFPCETLSVDTPPDTEIDRKVLLDWIESLRKPAAVMCYYDPQAIQVLNVCREYGIDVPKQISVLGVDNDELLCEAAIPPLSSIQPDHEYAGLLAAKQLNRLLKRPTASVATVKCPIRKIVERESSKPLPPSTHLVNDALAFIDANACNGITVQDVVAHLGVSRRLADLRFREVQHRSIRQLIEDKRLQTAEKKLCGTNLEINKIAVLCGYANIHAFEAAFRKRHHVTPLAFRSSHRF